MIFDRFFGKKEDKKEERRPAETTLDFEEIPQWIEREKNALDVEANDEVSKLGVERINLAFDNLDTIIEDLEERELDQEVIKKLENITLTSKKKFCENVRILLSKRKRFIPDGYLELRQFIAEAQETVNNINKAHQTHGRYLGITFQNSLKEIGKELKTIVTLLNTMTERMKDIKSKWEQLDSISEIIEENRLLHQSEMDVKLEGFEEERDKLVKELEELENKRNELIQDPSHTKFLEIQGRLEMIEKEMHEKNSQIYDITGPLKRILKKMHKSIQNGRYKTSYDDEKYLEEFIEHPALSIIADDEKLTRTNRLMETMLAAINEGVIDEKKSKLDKTVAIGRGIISGDIDDLKHEYSSLENEKEALLMAKESYDIENLKRVERDIEQCNHRLDVLNEELEHALQISEDVQGKKDKAKRKIKKIIEGFYPEITINL